MAKYNKSSVKKANVDSASRATMAMGSQSKKEKLSLKEYFKGVKLEMKKVVWPTKKELGSYTTYVLVTCAFFTLLFYAADTGILFGMKKLLGIDL